MRSRIFARFPDLPPIAREGFPSLWSLPSDQWHLLVPYAMRAITSDLRAHYEEVLQQAVSELGGSASHILRALKLLLFIAQQWDPVRDTPEVFLRDLVDLELVTPEKLPEVRDFLNEFLAELQADAPRRLRASIASAVIPSFLGVTTVVDFRAVLDRPYNLGDSASDYAPRAVGFVPTVIVRIRRDTGEVRDFVFQCEPHDLDLLISALTASLRDVEAARAAMPPMGE